LFIVKSGKFSNKGMGNINDMPGKKLPFGAINDSHLSRRKYFIQRVLIL